MTGCYLLRSFCRLVFLTATDRVLCEVRTEPVSVMWISEFSLQGVKIFVGFIARNVTLALISSGRRTGPVPPPKTPLGSAQPSAQLASGDLRIIAARPNFVLMS